MILTLLCFLAALKDTKISIVMSEIERSIPEQCQKCPILKARQDEYLGSYRQGMDILLRGLVEIDRYQNKEAYSSGNIQYYASASEESFEQAELAEQALSNTLLFVSDNCPGPGRGRRYGNIALTALAGWWPGKSHCRNPGFKNRNRFVQLSYQESGQWKSE